MNSYRSRSFFHLFTLLTVLLSLLGSAVSVTPAYAATIVVTNNADNGDGSLRQAIALASNGDTITFDNDYTITLASQLEIINKTITITGAGHHITISGNNAVRVFHVGDYSTGSSGNLTIDHLNIVNGKITGTDCAGSEAACGGGMLLESLTTATVLNSTFANNDGGLAGGAIYSYYGNPLTVTNSTFINNHALAYAGAIQFFYGSATLTNNTFIGNSALGYGGALLNNWGTVTFRNNIFANNTAGNGGNCNNSEGVFNNGGGNLVWGDTVDCPGVNANPLLGTSDYYGGDVPTAPLLPASAAIDAATSNCPPTDARGITRGSTCDAGAFESRGYTLTKISGDSQSAAINSAFTNPLNVQLTETGGSPLPGVVITFTAPSSGASASIIGSPATTNASGIASVNATAGNLVGPYNVTASATGVTGVDFALTNTTITTTTGVTSSANPSTYGESITITATVSPTPDGGTVVFKDNGTAITGCDAKSLSSGQATCATSVLTAGSHIITAEYSGNTSYALSSGTLAPNQQVNQATPIITWSNPANIVYGTALSAAQLNATANTPGTFTYDPALNTVLDAGPHTLHVDFIPTDATNYTNASKDVSITVTKATPLINWADPTAIDQGIPLSGTQLNAMADVPGTFTYTPATGTYLSAGAHTLHVDFVPTDTVNYTNASKDVSLTVNDHVLFSDVPNGYWARSFIERLSLNQVTSGCGGGNFCPDANATRAMMAVFVLRAAHGPDFAPPPATGTVFNDVSADSFAAAWIEELATEGITGGCGNSNFCPNAPVTRAQMAVFLVKAMYGINYVPPAASGMVFTDVPADGFAAAFIEKLSADGVTGGCGSNNFCPNTYITRAEIAVFLVTAFNLP